MDNSYDGAHAVAKNPSWRLAATFLSSTLAVTVFQAFLSSLICAEGNLRDGAHDLDAFFERKTEILAQEKDVECARERIYIYGTEGGV